MTRGRITTRAWIAACCWMSPISLAATVEFESVPVGTKYGEDFGYVPGQVVLTENGIKVSVEQFFLQQFTGFFQAEVVGSANDHELAIDNLSVMFDLTGLGFNVNSVTLGYVDLGGDDNFAVNGGSILQLAELSDIPANVAPGVTALVDGDSITLTGDIDRVLIGGQELSVDSIVAIPEPTSLVLLGAGGVLALRRLQRADGSTQIRRRQQSPPAGREHCVSTLMWEVSALFSSATTVRNHVSHPDWSSSSKP